MSNFVEIKNNGPELVETNYWESEYARHGYCFLSFNARCFRLLLAPTLERGISDMRAAERVIIGFGRSTQMRRDMIRVLFEDRSDSPYVVQLSAEQVDVIPESTSENDLLFALYTQSGKSFELPCDWRRANDIDNWFGD